MMNTLQIRMVQQSYAWLLTHTRTTGDRFFDKLYEVSPELRSLAAHPLPMLSRDWTLEIGRVVNHLHQPDRLQPLLERVAVRLHYLGITHWHYIVAGSLWLEVLEEQFGSRWHPSLAEAWAIAWHEVATQLQACQQGYDMPMLLAS